MKLKKINMAVFVLLAVSLILAACSPEPNTTMRMSGGTDRFSVECVGIIDDPIAYGDRRGIYIIKDRDTGKEYVGLSGVGISEVGSHMAGKARVSDER
jgi:predicted small secreted protein